MLTRCTENPLIRPSDVPASNDGYTVLGAFNPGACKYKNETILLMRVAENCPKEKGFVSIPYYDKNGPQVLKISEKDPDLIFKDTRGYFYKGKDYLSSMSHIRLARSKDGIHFTVEPEPFLYPTLPCESFGVEDARVVKIKDTYYINYTAVSSDGYVTMLATTTDFKTIKKEGIIFPPLNKDVAIFDEMVNGKYAALHRPDNHGWGLPAIWYATSPDLFNWGNHMCLLRPDGSPRESQKIGGGAAPIKTREGWLVIYHSKGDNSVYTLNLLLLDLKDPSRIIRKGNYPILIPKESYEKSGFFPNVVFTNGTVTQPNGDVWIYYGAGDECICLAITSIYELLEQLYI
ncbi:MAG: glycoside hydrolase family 130 protein [Marinifilaceae bacterium]